MLGTDEYGGTINVGIVSVKGAYSGKLRLKEKTAPEHYKMVVDGKGKQGFVRGSGTLDLEAHEINSTVVTYAGDVRVGGPLVQVGTARNRHRCKNDAAMVFAAAGAELKA
jgi:uncharacterized protein